MATRRSNDRILTYATSNHGHVRIKEISQEEAVRLTREAGLFEACGAEGCVGGDCLVNKFAAQVDPENDVWVYNHDGTYWFTSATFDTETMEYP